MRLVYEYLFDLVWPEEGCEALTSESLLEAARRTLQEAELTSVIIHQIIGLSGPPKQLVVSFESPDLGARRDHKLVVTRRLDSSVRMDGFRLDLSQSGLGGRWVDQAAGVTTKDYLYGVFEMWLLNDMESSP